MVNVETLTALLTETCFMFLTDPDCLPVRMISALQLIFSISCLQFTPLESPSIPACRQTGMLGMVVLKSIRSLFLPAGRQGGGAKLCHF